MNNRNLKSVFLWIGLVSSSAIHTIQDSTANIATCIVAAVCAGSSYRIVQETKIHPSALIALSSIATFAAYHTLHRSTPIGRLKRANALLNEVSRHTLARLTFENDKLFFDVVQDVYLTDDLPLISAYNHLIDLIPNVHYALSLINKASAEVSKDVLLQEECDASLSRANKLFKNIGDAVKRIREHKDYLSQLTIYKENIIQEKQTIAQEQIALAQLQMAESQQSSTFLKWIKAVLWRK